MEFRKVAVLGGGLLGGSIALALRGKIDCRLWFRSEDSAENARAIGFSEASSELSEAVRGADLLILAVPVGAMGDLATQAISAGLKKGCVVTDVGSVKQVPHEVLGKTLGSEGYPFVGSHPMAGSEQNGITSAQLGLMDGAACLLTNDSAASADVCSAVENFWSAIGCRCSWMKAAAHDDLVGRISHLPHAMAAATALIALQDPKLGDFAGGGLRDTTRVAGGNPDMWAEILIKNRKALIPLLQESIEEMREVLASLELADQERARVWLERAKTRRDALKPF